ALLAQALDGTDCHAGFPGDIHIPEGASLAILVTEQEHSCSQFSLRGDALLATNRFKLFAFRLG
ncbi:hypothetical protein N9I65_02085, partial [bacterium]|nr:hypothetical protein [bacterium]